MREALQAVENLKKRRKLGEARLKSVLEPKGASGTALSTKTLTVPQEPNFTGRSRAKNLDSSVSSNASESDVPFAERMAKLQRNGGGRSKTPVSKREGPAKLTEPKTPKFSSFQKRAPKVKSYAELEEEALKEAKRSQFKARPVNRSALESCGDVGVPKVMRKELTRPSSPKLRSAVRSGRSQSSSMDSLSSLSSSSLNSLSNFKARRVPKATHQRPANVTAPSQKKLTIPKSPNLTSTYRQRSSSVSATSSEEELSNSFKALDMPDLSRKFMPKHDSSKLTEPTPFQLTTDARHAAKEAQFKARQEAEARAAQDARRYKAHPVRTSSDLTTLGVHSVSKRPLTEPKPFALQSEAKHEHAASQWQSRVDRELEEEKGKFGSFCARPVPKVIGDNSKVYTPRRSSKPLTEVHDFQLNVDRRSQTHQQLSDRKAARERKMEAEKAAEEARRKEEEAREIRNMRRSMVVKAKPVPTSVYNGGPAVVHSSKPLTEPMSPHFRTDMRIRSART